MMRATAWATLALLLVSAQPTTAQRADTAPTGGFACAAGAKAMTRFELMFGMSRKAGRPISEPEWRTFLAEEVTPRFPDGFTVLPGYGQWRGAGAGAKITREPMRLLLVLAPPSGDSQERIEAIRSAFKRRFQQESVVRIESGACVAF